MSNFCEFGSEIFWLDCDGDRHHGFNGGFAVELAEKIVSGRSVTYRDQGFYALVEGEGEGYYPLPLLFAGREERVAAAEEAGKPCPSETWVAAKRAQVSVWARQVKREAFVASLGQPTGPLVLGRPAINA